MFGAVTVGGAPPAELTATAKITVAIRAIRKEIRISRLGCFMVRGWGVKGALGQALRRLRIQRISGIKTSSSRVIQIGSNVAGVRSRTTSAGSVNSRITP